MAFKFRYESLLVYRNHLKEKAETDLARAIEALRASEHALADFVQDRRRASAELEADLGRALGAATMRSYVDYLSYMDEKVRAQAADVAKQEIAVRRERKQLLLRTKEYRIMENLKEKDRVKWMLEQERRERILLNEIAVLRHRGTQP